MTIHTSHRNSELYSGAPVGAALSLSVHNRPKYHLRAGLQYLHFSGLKLTNNRAHAWVGTVEQGRACRRRFDDAAGCKLRSIQPIPTHSEEA